MTPPWSIYLVTSRPAKRRYLNCEGGIVDSCRRFVNEDPGLRLVYDSAQLIEYSVPRIRKPFTLTKGFAHGVTTHPEGAPSPGISVMLSRIIRRAMIDFYIIDIGVKLPSREWLRVGRGVIIVHDSTDPIGAPNGKISRQAAVVQQRWSIVVMIIGVHDPTQRQLPCAVHTCNSLGSHLCRAQGRQ